MVLTDIYRTFHPNRKEYTFLQLYGPFSKTDHIFRYKASLKKYKKTEIMFCILFNQHQLELDISIPRHRRKFTNSWELNNSLLNEKLIQSEIVKELKDILELNENEYTTYLNLGDKEGSPKRQVPSRYARAIVVRSLLE